MSPIRPTPSAGIRRLFFFLVCAFAFLALNGCNQAKEESARAKEEHADGEHGEGEAHAGEEPGEESHEGDEEGGALHLEGVRGVTFVAVGEPRDEGAWFAAEAISDPGAEAVLSAPISGQVAAFRSAPGSAVAKGAAVIELRSPELTDLSARWLAARARATRAQSDVERERKLARAGATSAREVEAAEAEVAVAEAEERGARLALEGRGVDPKSVEQGAGSTFVVRAPRAGTIARFEVSLGETVESGRLLGRLVAPGAALAQVELSLPGPQAWPAGTVTEARRSDGSRWRAVVEGTPPALSPDTRRLRYRVRLEGEALPGIGSELPSVRSELPLAGTPLEVRVPLARAVVLPQTALQQVEGSWGVFVKVERDGESQAEFRPVTKGAELGSDVMILAGVTPGEQVATEGAYLLKALWLKRAGGGGGHDH
jgi:cobalt-zinc-cadmium efflux system membrane fusion protein